MKRVCLLAALLSIIQVSVSSTYGERISVPENYRGTFPFCLRQVARVSDGRYVAELAGDEDGVFQLDPKSGFLCALKPFDREKQNSYTVTVMGDNDTVTVYIEVLDDNDNMPVLDQGSLRGIVSRGSRAGVSFMHVRATDADDPDTENADLRYKAEDNNLFQIEPMTGAVSLTEQGSTYLSQNVGSHFTLRVQVKDLGDSPMGYVAAGNLEIVAAENTWAGPSSVSILENENRTYPWIISNVLWNSTEVHYLLSGSFAGDLFTVDENGDIYLTEELDRETQDKYLIKVSALNNDNVLHSDPLEMTVTVLDDNDNAPAFPQHTYNVEITEAMVTGSLLLVLKAEDVDDPETKNAQIVYKIVSQEPRLPGDALFHIGEETGHLTLLDNTGMAQRYILQVSATDLAGSYGGLSTTCTVIIDVTDVNDSPPIFVENQFPPFLVSEDTPPGAVIATLTATDDDEETLNRLIEFSVESGNEDGTFGVIVDEERNTMSVFLQKELDYEHTQEYNVTFLVRNKAELSGAEYGPGSTASIQISVGNVNEAPIFAQTLYEVDVPENTQTGSVILTAEASDPDIYNQASLRYSIRNDSRKRLSIQEDSGKILLIHPLDREEHGATYNVELVVQEEGDGGLSATAELAIHILDVNDNIPSLVGDYTETHFCTPQREEQTVVIQAYDKDTEGSGDPFTFTLPDDVARQRQWKVTSLNGTHAYLSMARSYLEPKVYHVPIIITDSGTPPQHTRVPFTVIVCHCTTSGYCKMGVERMPGKPTVSSALGITLGTLGVIGVFLIIIFTRLSLSPSKKIETPDTIPLRNTA